MLSLVMTEMREGLQVHLHLHVNCPLFFSDSNGNWSGFLNYPKKKIESKAVQRFFSTCTCGQTDR